MTKTQKAKADLDRAIARRDEWQRKVDDLQQRYEEAQNTEIIGVVRQAQLTPEQLADVIAKARAGILDALPENPDAPTVPITIKPVKLTKEVEEVYLDED